MKITLGYFVFPALAAALGWQKHHEVLWTIFDATLGLFYCLYRLVEWLV